MYIIIPILTIPSDKNLPRQKTKVAASHKQIKKKKKKQLGLAAVLFSVVS